MVLRRGPPCFWKESFRSHPVKRPILAGNGLQRLLWTCGVCAHPALAGVLLHPVLLPLACLTGGGGFPVGTWSPAPASLVSLDQGCPVQGPETPEGYWRGVGSALLFPPIFSWVSFLEDWAKCRSSIRVLGLSLWGSFYARVSFGLRLLWLLPSSLEWGGRQREEETDKEVWLSFWFLSRGSREGAESFQGRWTSEEPLQDSAEGRLVPKFLISLSFLWSWRKVIPPLNLFLNILLEKFLD